MKSVVGVLSDLIRIPSVSRFSNRPVVEYAAALLHTAKWQTRLFAYQDASGVEKVNLIAAPAGENIDDPAVELAFFCHTDTVPYSSEWQGAIHPHQELGMLHGCGACDVKGFLACLLVAVGQTPWQQLRQGLRLVLTADEEIGCVGAAHLLSHASIRPRRAVVGEPTSLQPARAGKGYWLAEITIVGREAHSAHPAEGASAIYGAAQWVAAIESYSRELSNTQNAFFTPAYSTLNIGTIEGGTAKNIVPGVCRFLLECRPLPGFSADTLLAELHRIGEAIRRSHGCDYAIEVLRQQAAFETRAEAQLVHTMEALTGREAISIPFGSEASLLATVAEEVVVFGPGDMRTAHSERECVPIRELELAVGHLKDLMHTPRES